MSGQTVSVREAALSCIKATITFSFLKEDCWLGGRTGLLCAPVRKASLKASIATNSLLFQKEGCGSWAFYRTACLMRGEARKSVCHTLSSPESGRQSGLQIRFTHRRLSSSNGKSDFVAHTAGVPPSELGAVACVAVVGGSIGKPERLCGGCGSWVVLFGWIWGNRCYIETRKAVFSLL